MGQYTLDFAESWWHLICNCRQMQSEFTSATGAETKNPPCGWVKYS
jgi:hypothetical protein